MSERNIMAYTGGRCRALSPVLLLTGMGVAAHTWWQAPDHQQQSRVMNRVPFGQRVLLWPSLTAQRQVFAYDRAGLGKSDPPTHPQGLDQYLADLDAAWRGLGIAEPAVLVGHSLGGLLAYAAALRFPKRVAGLLLLDPSFPTQGRGLCGIERAAGRGDAYLAQLERHAAEHPERPKLRELFFWSESQCMSLGELPCTVISRGVWQTPQQVYRRTGHRVREATLAQRRQLMGGLHRQYAALSRRGRHVVARQSGHFIYLDQPGLCLRELNRLV